MLECGLINPSTSKYGTPVILIKKHNGGKRMCIDYRALNHLTTTNNYPLLRIDDLFNHLKNTWVYSKLDLLSGYWQIPVKEEDWHKLAFKTNLGLWEPRVMPFGVKNGPACFQRVMNDVFQNSYGVNMLVYLDDILIYSPGEEEHLEDLRSVLTQLREHGYYVKKSKCEFGKREIDWVGHKLIENGIAVQPNKTKVIEEWKQPTNITELRAFLGMVNYYHKFVSRMAMIVRPLNELLQKDHMWN